MGKWRLSLSKSIVHSVDWAVESVPTYTIGDLIEKLSNAIISYYEFRVTIKNHSTESVFMENNVIEDYVLKMLCIKRFVLLLNTTQNC